MVLQNHDDYVAIGVFETRWKLCASILAVFVILVCQLIGNSGVYEYPWTIGQSLRVFRNGPPKWYFQPKDSASSGYFPEYYMRLDALHRLGESRHLCFPVFAHLLRKVNLSNYPDPLTPGTKTQCPPLRVVKHPYYWVWPLPCLLILARDCDQETAKELEDFVNREVDMRRLDDPRVILACDTLLAFDRGRYSASFRPLLDDNGDNDQNRLGKMLLLMSLYRTYMILEDIPDCVTPLSRDYWKHVRNWCEGLSEILKSEGRWDGRDLQVFFDRFPRHDVWVIETTDEGNWQYQVKTYIKDKHLDWYHKIDVTMTPSPSMWESDFKALLQHWDEKTNYAGGKEGSDANSDGR